MFARGSHAFESAGEPYVARAKHRPTVAVAEGSQVFDLLDGLAGEHLQRRLGVD